ncbi:hypothetical protein ACH5RR_015245 [Cinchona calisaya]|uniref:Uncharacterized protein n=1 Tax=Cinchona calisaya TaxID=153742 RepID=A0ABD2ZSL1_9GENT
MSASSDAKREFRERQDDKVACKFSLVTSNGGIATHKFSEISAFQKVVSLWSFPMWILIGPTLKPTPLLNLNVKRWHARSLPASALFSLLTNFFCCNLQ